MSYTAPRRSNNVPKPDTVADYHSTLRRSEVIHRQSSKWRHPTPITPPFPTPITSPHAAHESRSARLLLSYHDLERALASRGLNTARLILLFSTATAVGTVLAWPRIKKWGAVEGAEVAAASLEREELLLKASSMVHEVLSNAETEKRVERVLKVAAGRLMEDEQFMQYVVHWTAKVLTGALQCEKFREQGGKYVARVLEESETRKSAETFLADAIQKVVDDEGVQDKVGKGLWSSVRASVIGRWRPREVVKRGDGELGQVLNECVEAKKATVVAANAPEVGEGLSGVDSNGRDLPTDGIVECVKSQERKSSRTTQQVVKKREGEKG